MKVSLYLDIWPFHREGMVLTAHSSPMSKLKDATRYKITFEIPDPAKPDKYIVLIPENVEEMYELVE